MPHYAHNFLVTLITFIKIAADIVTDN